MYILYVETHDLIMICYLSLWVRGTSIYKWKRYEEIISYLTKDNRLDLSVIHHGYNLVYYRKPKHFRV